MKNRVGSGDPFDSLIADEGAPNDPVNSFFCAAASDMRSSNDTRSAAEKTVRVIPPP